MKVDQIEEAHKILKEVKGIENVIHNSFSSHPKKVRCPTENYHVDIEIPYGIWMDFLYARRKELNQKLKELGIEF